MTDSIYNLLLGAIQGVTELLPISSSGHLIIFDIFTKREPVVAVMVLLHLASALALLTIYIKDYFEIFKRKDWFQKYLVIGIGMIPVVLIGVILGDKIEVMFYNKFFIGFNLLFWGIVMIYTEDFESKRQSSRKDIKIKDSILIGLFQILSLLPGTSRSGVTTVTGVLRGIDKPTALNFSFMMGIPLLLGTFIYSYTLSDVSMDFDSMAVIAFVSAFVTSLIAGLMLKKYSKEKFLTFFGYYRIVVGIVVLLFL